MNLLVKNKKKKFNFVLNAIFFSVLIISNADADETSGRIIREIVEEVDREMTQLENQVSGLSQKSNILLVKLQKLKKESNKLANTGNIIDHEKIKAEMLVVCAKLNEQDLQEIKVYKQTIGALIPKLDRLQQEIKKIGSMGFDHEDEFFAFRREVGKMMTNSVRIIQQLRKVTQENNSHEFAAIEETLLGTYEIFNVSNRLGPNSYSQVVKNIRGLEITFAQLNNVEQLLQQERGRLKADNLTQLSKLALIRLFSGRLNIKNVSQLPSRKAKSIADRIGIYATSSNRTNCEIMDNASPALSKSRQVKLDKMAAGNLF